MADCPASLAHRDDASGPSGRLCVLLPLPLAAALDYRAADGEASPEPGRFVRVHLGSRQVIGVVWEGGSGVDVTRHTSAPGTWLVDCPRIWRTPSTMWFMPWM